MHVQSTLVGRHPLKRLAGTAVFLVSLGMGAVSLSSTTAEAVGPAPIVSVAGDIACGTTIGAYHHGAGTATQCRQKYTAALLPGSDAVWTLGDHVYPTATTKQISAAYAPTWGKFRSITYPSPGDHDYGTIGARGYFNYFHKPKYYSFNMAGWHVVSLNAEIDHSANSA